MRIPTVLSGRVRLWEDGEQGRHQGHLSTPGGKLSWWCMLISDISYGAVKPRKSRKLTLKRACYAARSKEALKRPTIPWEKADDCSHLSWWSRGRLCSPPLILSLSHSQQSCSPLLHPKDSWFSIPHHVQPKQDLRYTYKVHLLINSNRALYVMSYKKPTTQKQRGYFKFYTHCSNQTHPDIILLLFILTCY